MIWRYPEKSYTKQIAEVLNCGLSKIGELAFDLEDGACTVANNDIYLCFSQHDQSATKTCIKKSDPLIAGTNINDTTYGHSKAYIAASTGKSVLNFSFSSLIFRFIADSWWSFCWQR